MNKKKFFKIILFTILVLVITCLGFVGNYFYNLALNPDTPKDIIFGTPEEASTTSGQVLDEDKEWLLNSQNYTDEYITSSDNLKLHSYKIQNTIPSNKWAIVVHGYTSEVLI